MNIRYLNSLPEDVPLRNKKTGPIQLQLDEFMKTDSPIMEVSIAKHYKNIEVARTTWLKAIKTSGHSMRIMVSKNKEAIYVVKVKPNGNK